MAHFAEIDGSNTVLRVLVVADVHEAEGQVFLADGLGLGGTWVQTSYNSRGGKRYDPRTNQVIGDSHFRFNYASPGFTYDLNRDAFIPPKPHPTAVLNEHSCLWEIPPEVLIDQSVSDELAE